ncbi:EDSAP-1 family PEP-CTERM protein [Janthinobacterium sp. GW458P]|uniref:EDSAP-1 family PEP-CTERM protein n=1 Tax=Janthinobacterium sp. GW458P TaxID=1981504 RepID=UPI00186775DC|nr:EDSAP-1 family PEP-CTERM protein [Janthinobacterium sp. GW458P]MBE3025438.1 PEP-CTERM sorting domain-containing protein [Janthinobacterium sp. GW458P]
MMTFFCTRLPAAVLTLLLLGSSGAARATAYGYSYINAYGLTISNPSGSISLVSNIDLSRTTASLNGSGVIRGGSNEIDAPQAARGAVSKGQNDFTQQGMGNASYARGDAQIISSQIPPFPPGSTSTHTVNAAEAFLTGAGTADASGRNGSSTALAINIVVGEPGATLAFNFQAQPYMQLFLDAQAGLGSSASANVGLTFTLIDENGQVAFNWAPDGTLGSGILGGTELADSANLNTGYAQSPLTSGSLFTYDPTGCGAPTGTGSGTDCGGLFSAVTDNLAAGSYTLVLNMINSTELAYVPSSTPMPSPGTLALMAAGCAALASMRPRWRAPWRQAGPSPDALFARARGHDQIP